jgi:stearoyl-CoA desaturase (delta-9 desaturase)
MVTKQWVAIHRKHHRDTDVEGDPHSPIIYGLPTVLFKGALLYHRASKNFATLEAYGAGTPDDWIERKLYTPHSRLGILLMLVIDLVLFGPWGLVVWGVQMIWIPLTAAGIINGLGHYYGYRNYDTKDHSHNIIPWDIIIGGECLHNNHHKDPANPKLSHESWEFDIGWMWLTLFRNLRLAKLTR